MAKLVAEVLADLDGIVPLAKAAGWDPVGLQFGDLESPVQSIAVCHEVTEIVADQLIARGIDLAVTYHPLLFRPVTRLVVGSGPAGRAHRLIAGGIALATVHTAFDVAPGGTADALAAALGLRKCEGFGPAWGAGAAKIVTFVPTGDAVRLVDSMSRAGAGRIGAYTACSYRAEGIGTFFAEKSTRPTKGAVGAFNEESEQRVEMIAPQSSVDHVVAALVAAHPYEEPAYDVIETRSNAGFVGRVGDLERPMDLGELAGVVRARLGGVVRVGGDGEVKRVAVVPGSGGSFLGAVDADAIVTGDVSHHQARAAIAAGTSIIDPGHAATERPGVAALYAAVDVLVDEVVDLTDTDPDPWKE
jgi:dinuclear metal center YbgI/SA1388 family protein